MDAPTDALAHRIGTLRLRAGGEAAAPRVRMERLLGGVDPRPAGVPPATVLIVKRLSDPAPARLRPALAATAIDPTWERAWRDELARCHARAARPMMGPVAADAEAVRFADRAEMLACLAADRCADQARSRWWWRLLRDGRGSIAREGGDGPEGVFPLLARHPILVPAILHHLTRSGRVAAVTDALSPQQVAELVAALCRAYGLPDLLPASPSCRAPHPSRHPTTPDPARDAPAQADNAGGPGELGRDGSRASGGAPMPMQAPLRAPTRARGLLRQLAEALFQRPGTARDPEFQRRWRQAWAGTDRRTFAPPPAGPRTPSAAARAGTSALPNGLSSAFPGASATDADSSPAGPRGIGSAPVARPIAQPGPPTRPAKARRRPPTSPAAADLGSGENDPVPRSPGRQRRSRPALASASAPAGPTSGPPAETSPGTGWTSHPNGAPEAVPQPVREPRAAARNSAGEAAGDRPSTPAWSVPRSRAKQGDGAPSGAAAPDRAPARVPAEGTEDDHEPDFEQGVDTELGGVFYLLNLMLRLDLPACFEADWGLAGRLGPWGTLAALARGLLGERGEDLDRDPLWPALRALGGDAAEEPLGLGLRSEHGFRLPVAWPARIEDPTRAILRWCGDAGRLKIWSESGYLLCDQPGGGGPDLARERLRPYLDETGDRSGPRDQARRDWTLREGDAGAIPHGRLGADSASRFAPALRAWLTAVLPYLDRYAKQVFAADGPNPGRALLLHQGRLYLSSTHVDLVVPLDRVCIPVRMAGLDRDPGWVADLGRVVALHFD